MRLSHGSPALSASFDDPNLVSVGGLAPVLALAQSCQLGDLVAEKLTLKAIGGVNAAIKVPALVAGMVAGADSITDMDLLRHGGMGRLFTGIRAPSTLGTFLRAFTFGHVRQLDSIAAALLTSLVAATPLLPGANRVTFLDLDDTMRQTHGYAKQGAGYGYTKIKGLNALLATISTPTAAPVIGAARLRRGAVKSARGAQHLVAEALGTARAVGAGGPDRSGLVLLRGDSAFYGHAVIAAARRGGARFSITARMDAAVRKAIAAIDPEAWTPIRYPQAVWDEQEQCWISDAEVAETSFTAFTSRRKADHVTARLIVRRVRRLNPASVPTGQGELFAAHRHHAVFTDSPEPMLAAETTHRQHAVIEQVHADLKAGPLAHLPSGSFAANSAWLVLAAMAFNLTRAAGALASAFHAKATTGTIRAQLIAVPARLARSARRLRLHLPRDWPWEHAWTQLFDATGGPPAAA
ncbi:IS1380 family transposase [Geodermatophilus marinus]|uniref:IS1380 family transposase n=1 Tax=Geodermatophilus sp. LHW52908 TaxID=2303986 RepID=UPI000E3E3F37|nr:IS1380 family transposase [Geodermatophilus sp. LHW52908]RFU19746.1 IS1380 family transposase [Geodermatophilus sp. LHW52908]